jgi:esterase/lipase superfamily enzyme
MDYFFSRRTYDQTSHRFNNNVSAITRYVGLGPASDGQSSGGLFDAVKWAKAVGKQSKNGEILIFVHGFNTPQDLFLRRLRQIKRKVVARGFRGAVTGFDWPSHAKGSWSGYKSDRRRAEKIAQFLVLDGIKLLRKHNPGCKIHLMAHSMGTYVSSLGLSRVGDHHGVGKIEQAIHIAADLNHETMMQGAGFALVWDRRCKRLTNYYSKWDEVLELSEQTVNFNKKRSGRHGIRTNAPTRFEDVSVSDRFHEAIEKRKRTWIYSHNWHFDDDRFVDDTVAVLGGKSKSAIPTRKDFGGSDQRI